MSEDWARERQVVLETFGNMLAKVTGDGSKKRQQGEKPPWWKDGSHWPALFRHLTAFEKGEFVDADSKANTLVHLAWRALAIAYIEDTSADSITKTCPACCDEKPLSEFVRGSKTSWFGRGSYCKACHAAKVRASKYGQTADQLDEMLRMQGGRCAICRRQRKAGEKEFAVDHDHSTGEIRGVLCGECNAALGLFQDNISILLEAVKYLAKAEPQEGYDAGNGGIDPACTML
jgi:hypothetical protein